MIIVIIILSFSFFDLSLSLPFLSCARDTSPVVWSG